MPFITVRERTAMVKVTAFLEAVPVLELRDREGGIIPSHISVVYSSLVGGSAWSAEVLISGPRTHPRPGHEGELYAAIFPEELHRAPDWVAGFVDLNEPDAALRGAVA